MAVSPGLLIAASSSAVLGLPLALPLARPVGCAVLSPSAMASLSLKPNPLILKSKTKFTNANAIQLE